MKLRVLATAILIGSLSSSVFAADSKNAAAQPAAAVSAPAPAPTAAHPAANTLATDEDKFSYAIGWDIGDKLKQTGLKVNPAILAQAAKDSLLGAQPLLTVNQRQEIVQKMQKEFMAKKEAEFKMQAEKNKQAGDAFLAANKAKPGVKTTADGLQYKVIEEGKGQQPGSNDEVVVEYEGKLINGQVFDSSFKRGKPAVAKVADVIPGWKEALQMMKAGSKWEVVIPPALGYGEAGLMGSPIGPNETLVFTIKLVSVNHANAAQPAAVKK